MTAIMLGPIEDLSAASARLREQEVDAKRARRALAKEIAKMKMCVCGEPDCIGQGLIVPKFFDHTVDEDGDIVDLDQEMEAHHLVPCVVIGSGKLTMLVESSAGRLVILDRIPGDTRIFAHGEEGWIYSFATEDSAVLESYFIRGKDEPTGARRRLLIHLAKLKKAEEPVVTTTPIETLSVAPQVLSLFEVQV